MNGVTAILLGHGSRPDMQAKTINCQACGKPHICIESLDKSVGIIGYVEDIRDFVAALTHVVNYYEEKAGI